MIKRFLKKLFPVKYLLRDLINALRDFKHLYVSENSKSVEEHKVLLKLLVELRDSQARFQQETTNSLIALHDKIDKNSNLVLKGTHTLQEKISEVGEGVLNILPVNYENNGVIKHVQACVSNDLKEAAIVIKQGIENLDLKTNPGNALVRYISHRDTIDLKHVASLEDYIALTKYRSTGQLFQDLWVLWELKEKRNGYFIDFGATDGFDLSNTYLLEKEFGWSGILSEPQPFWHENLRKNRSAIIDTRCVWKESGTTLTFSIPDRKELAGVLETGISDMYATERKTGSQISVNTISLADMLKEHNAPKKIDFLSIDTEGSEFTILNEFDFNAFDISLICVEHNYKSEEREKIYSLLTQNGYVRKYEKLSEFDDWYSRL